MILDAWARSRSLIKTDVFNKGK